MLDGKRYFAEFPDEQPQKGVHARLDQKGVHARLDQKGVHARLDQKGVHARLDCKQQTGVHAPDAIRASLAKLARLERELARFLRDTIATDRNG